MEPNTKIKLKSGVILKQGDDQCGIIFDTNSGATLALNYTGCFICQWLSEINTVKTIEDKLIEAFVFLPISTEKKVMDFLEILESNEMLETCQ